MKNIIKKTGNKIWPNGSFIRGQIRRLFQSLQRGKIKQICHFINSGHVVKRIKIKKWSQAGTKLCLQVGGGKHLKIGDGWINGDLIDGDIYLNGSRKLPFPSGTLDLIFTEHFFEHLSQEDGLFFLDEAYRVLKKGGILRQSTPDLKGIVDIWLNKNKNVDLEVVIKRHINNHRKSDAFIFENGCQFFNDMFRLWGHQFIYDEATLEMATRGAGFGDVIKVEFGEPGFTSLTLGLERHADYDWMKNAFVLILEARK